MMTTTTLLLGRREGVDIRVLQHFDPILSIVFAEELLLNSLIMAEDVN